MVKISAVIPAYNVEEYLTECVESILNQGVECEVIIINDGSKDKTLQVAKNLAEKYDNITVLDQENSGQSVARNRGIEIAKGEYLLLLDSDDYIQADTLSTLYKFCKENDLDYIKTGWNTFDENGKNFITLPKTKSINKVIDSKTYFCELIDAGYNCIIWNGLVKRDFIVKNNLKYYEGIQYEDNLFALELMLTDFTAKCMQTEIIFVYNRLHENTTTSSVPKLKKITDILTNVKEMDEFILTLNEDLRPFAKKAVSSLVYAMTGVFFRLEKADRKQAKKIIPKKVLKEAIKYPYDNFQKNKLITFTYFRPILTLYNATIRKILMKKREKKRYNG